MIAPTCHKVSSEMPAKSVIIIDNLKGTWWSACTSDKVVPTARGE